MSDSNSHLYYEGYDQKISSKITAYLMANLSESLNAKDISALFGISNATLQRIFRRVFGLSYRQYLTNLRMNKAMELLNEGALVKQMMYETGYKSRSAFNQAFIKRFKYPPTYFRRG